VNAIGARRAALIMAAMHPADRRWMLSQMPRAWRPALMPLIAEAQVHAAMDPELLRAALDDKREASVHDLPTPDVLIVVLDRLAGPWVARILAAAAPDHAEMYLSTCEVERGRAIRREMADLPTLFPAAMAGSLVRYLAEAGQALRTEGALR
jgi:hypothetical protein